MHYELLRCQMSRCVLMSALLSQGKLRAPKMILCMVIDIDNIRAVVQILVSFPG